MQTEFEARFLDLDPTKIIQTLASRSAECTMPRTLMRRIVFKNNDIESRGGWLRLRQQGERTFLTYKQVTSEVSAIDTTLEAEVEVGGFDATKTLLEAMGFTALRYQENYREEWTLDGVMFDFDTWPGLPTFLEVEGPDEGAVHRAAEALGLQLSHASFGTVDEVYLSVLGRDILAESELIFTE